jgi:hypothetical protein
MRKKLLYDGGRGFRSMFIVVSLLVGCAASHGQPNHYFFSDVDTTEAYESSGFCRTLNYYWDQAVIRPDGRIVFVFVDNYKLYYYESADLGVTWEEHYIETGWDGFIYTAMAGLTIDGRLVIVFSMNELFNNGLVPFGSEFRYTLMGAVQDGDGWAIGPLWTATANSGMLPFGTITTKSGIVHVILYKYGWWNYGGELYEVMYDPVENKWSDVQTIKIFNDRPVDRSTFHVCKLAEGENDTIICVYQRHCSDTKYHNLEVIMKGADGWTGEEVILEQSDYATYNRFDLDYDRYGHMYFTWFIPHGPEGPELYIAHNSLREFEKHLLFAATDTLQKVSVHPHPDGVAYLYFTLRHALPQVWRLSEQGVEPTGYLPAFETEDSADVMRFHYHIPLKNNFSVLPGSGEDEKETGPGLFAFTNRYNGKEGNTVLRYPVVFVRANLEEEQQPVGALRSPVKGFGIWPNPGDGHFMITTGEEAAVSFYHVFNIAGSRVGAFTAADGGRADISGLAAGIYFIRERDGGAVVKYVKR